MSSAIAGTPKSSCGGRRPLRIQADVALFSRRLQIGTMPPLSALLLLTAAGSSLPGLPASLPGKAEAAAAFFEREANICRGLIDICEGGVGMRSAEEVTGLHCRAGRRGIASCRFEIAGNRCRAAFVSAAAGAEHRRALEWSQLPERTDHVWAVAWTRSPEPRGPRIRCRARDQDGLRLDEGQQSAWTELPNVIASGAKQSSSSRSLDCRVAALLAMTGERLKPPRLSGSPASARGGPDAFS
jgi:hypothetical protein